MKINYKLLMDEEIAKIKNLEKKPSLLLHACCAPCLSAVLEVLCDYFDITVYFYNPNISPKEEYDFRLSELKRMLLEMGMDDVKVVEPSYDNEAFLKLSEGLEELSEGGARCEKCYRLRLSESVSFAKENGFDYVTTTLSISPHKNAQLLNQIGLDLEDAFGVKYLCSDFKKGEGYKRSCQLSKEYNLYRQNYCGCVFSKRAAENNK